MSKAQPPGLPVDLVSAVYFCPGCGGKHTFGAAFFAETGQNPDVCPGCGAALTPDDRMFHVEADTEAELAQKKAALFARRDQALPATPKPADPEELKRQRIHNLEAELARLKDD
ncbi:hypothetical protein [Nonomuraea typhae]|uniref:hypothetical protein n=1 Tax=Nonomuraea typhae TaxID=2603600 RepID=UPI0012FC3A9F|nr:hypothetical protein [Nonomuraea typhae]